MTLSPLFTGSKGLALRDIPLLSGNITANGGIVSVDVSRVSNLVLHCKGTFSTVNCTFEASLDSTDGADGTWFVVQAARSSTNTIESATGNLSAAPTYSWELSVNAYRMFRVRATAWTSGTQVWMIQSGELAIEPVPAIPIHAVTQSGAWSVTNIPATTQGASTLHHLISAATTNATSVKNAAGVINDITLSNTSAAAKYFKLYNKATAPTVGTDTPVRTVLIPPNSTLSFGCGPFGIRLATGIAYALTGGVAVADTAAVAANDVAVSISYT